MTHSLKKRLATCLVTEHRMSPKTSSIVMKFVYIFVLFYDIKYIS